MNKILNLINNKNNMLQKYQINVGYSSDESLCFWTKNKGVIGTEISFYNDKNNQSLNINIFHTVLFNLNDCNLSEALTLYNTKKDIILSKYASFNNEDCDKINLELNDFSIDLILFDVYIEYNIIISFNHFKRIIFLVYKCFLKKIYIKYIDFTNKPEIIEDLLNFYEEFLLDD